MSITAEPPWMSRKAFVDFALRELTSRLATFDREILICTSGDSVPQLLPVGPGTGRHICADNDTRTGRRAAVDAFLSRCQQDLPSKITRQHISRAAGHTTPRQFQFWQAGKDRLPGTTRGATTTDERNFRRLLNMNPVEFLALLKRKGII